MFGSRVGGRPPSWIISNGHVSATAHSIHLYMARNAHGAVIFAIAHLSCSQYGMLSEITRLTIYVQTKAFFTTVKRHEHSAMNDNQSEQRQ